jgi:MFS family permease
MVIVNTVVFVRDVLGRGDGDVAWALGVSGAGAMLAALALPRLLDRLPDRPVMLAGGGLLVLGLALTALTDSFAELLAVWFLLGVGLSVVQTPTGRLVQRSGGPAQWPALFAAQFSLSHACWLLTYPLAGVVGSEGGPRRSKLSACPSWR